MTRVKGGVLHAKRRKGILKHTKGYRWGRKSKIKVAKVAKMKAGQYAFDDRKVKKRNARRLWSIRINAASRELGLSYSQLMGLLKKKQIGLDRKVLSQIAASYKNLFEQIVNAAK